MGQGTVRSVAAGTVVALEAPEVIVVAQAAPVVIVAAPEALEEIVVEEDLTAVETVATTKSHAATEA